MSTHNIYFHGEIRKIFNWKLLLSGAMNVISKCAKVCSQDYKLWWCLCIAVAIPETLSFYTVQSNQF